MTERIRVLYLILIMVSGSLLVAGMTIWILYRAAFEEEKARLVETTQSQARLIEAMARFDRVHSAHHPDGWEGATLSQIEEAHREYEGFGNSGEVSFARREGGLIVFLLRHRHGFVERPEPIPFHSRLAEPMRRALRGESGTVVGLDYRGEVVLAAHEPVAVLDSGIVAKIDIAEIRAPFMRAGLMATGFTLLVVFAGTVLFVRVSNPLVIGLERRSRELKKTFTALRESEERFRKTFELAGVGIVHTSLDGRFIRVNQRYCEIVGYSRDELLMLTFQDLTHPDDLEDDLANVQRILNGEIDTYAMEKRYRRRDHSVVWVNLTVSLNRDESQDPTHFIAVIVDTTERKQAEIGVKESLAEKEVLLREIHHRVKNNMQVISSLLNLQARGIGDMRLRKMFQESQSRVRAMALIHEILYESEDLSRVGLEVYITKLATSLVRMYGTEPGRINLVVGVKGVTLGLDDTVPCGLVINELLSNSLKYAFKNGEQGEIRIEAAPTEEDEIELVVRDNGPGIPDDIDIRNTDTMGMRLVTGLVENQLRGHVHLDRSSGTRFTIRFKPTGLGTGV